MSEPRETVLAWWRAMQQGDLESLEALALRDYMSCGGPDGRTLGRDELLTGAASFFAEAVVERCAVDDLELRDLGDVAVCSYRWSETGRHRGAPFSLAGVATDVLVSTEDGWRYQAHHVSMNGPTA